MKPEAHLMKARRAWNDLENAILAAIIKYYANRRSMRQALVSYSGLNKSHLAFLPFSTHDFRGFAIELDVTKTPN